MAESLSDISAVELFKVVASELEPDPADDTIIELYIDLASETVDPTVFRKVYKQAVVYLAAHLKAMDDRAAASGSVGGGAVGPITGERAGEVSINYGFAGSSGNFAGENEGLRSTHWGRRFVALRRSRQGVKPLSTQQYYSWPVASD